MGERVGDAAAMETRPAVRDTIGRPPGLDLVRVAGTTRMSKGIRGRLVRGRAQAARRRGDPEGRPLRGHGAGSGGA
jgi:hypothetical protein